MTPNYTDKKSKRDKDEAIHRIKNSIDRPSQMREEC